MWEYYWMHMRPFGQVLTDMERRGIRVNAEEYLASVEQTARQDRARHECTFRSWVASLYPTELRAHGMALNPASSAQLQTLLFGGSKIEKTGEFLETRRTFSVPRTEIPTEALEALEEQPQRKEQQAASEETDSNANGKVTEKEGHRITK